LGKSSGSNDLIDIIAAFFKRLDFTKSRKRKKDKKSGIHKYYKQRP